MGNRKGNKYRFILVDGNESIEVVVIPLRDLLVCWTEAIPETDECSREFRCSWAAQSQMCVTPLCGIQRAQVVAPNEAGSAIDDQQLAMIQGITTRIQQLPGTTNGTVFQHMNSRMKGRLEGARDDEIAKAIKDDIDCNPLRGFPREMLLKFLANSIIFPYVRF